jgi:cytochrome c biogenesis protein CcmG/thiol:disulfide interchange protein DsbE
LRLAIALFLVLGIVWAGAAGADYQLGEPVQDFSVSGLDGQDITLSQFQGQVVLINFFATWCPPCNDEVPLLQELFEEHGQDGLAILGIDLLESPAQVSSWAQGHGLTYPIGITPNWDLFREFPMAGGIPYNAVIDPIGILRYSQYGLNMEEITDLVEGLLPEDPVTRDLTSWDAVRALYR